MERVKVCESLRQERDIALDALQSRGLTSVTREILEGILFSVYLMFSICTSPLLYALLIVMIFHAEIFIQQLHDM